MKLTLDALKERADAVVSEELLNSISGGVTNSCHITDFEVLDPTDEIIE